MSQSHNLFRKYWTSTAGRVLLKRIGRLLILLIFLLSLFGSAPIRVQATTITFTGEELLGKPTDSSITINIVPNATIEYYYEYGTTQGGPYTMQTTNYTATGGQPHEAVINSLTPNTRYYYRMIYDGDGDVDDGDFEVRDEHTFHTQRAPGEVFVFTITSDSHENMNSYHRQAMQNVKNDQPDFHLDLGDTFYVDGTTSQSQVDAEYLEYRDPLYMGAIGPSVPIFLTPGNHEDEEGWNLDDTPFSIALGSIQARKAYYPTPVTDGFYSGNDDPLAAIDEATYGDELREDYYAWEWGDALFVVIDEYQYTMANPYGSAAGEGSDDPDTADQWIWTLGAQQFDWFKQTIANSNAKYKFVFSHHMLGGITRDIVGVDAGYVRGGAEAAAYFEWGGKNADGTPGFSSHRSETDFGTTPIHQMMVDYGVSAYFHGHDHQYVYETRDGIVYQEVPSPSMTGSGFSGIYYEGDFGDYQTIEILPNSGHLRVTVTPDEATVEYVRSNISEVSYTYTIEPRVVGPTHTLTMAVDPASGGSTNPSVGDHNYPEGNEVNISATANPGYVFDYWEGDVADPDSANTTVTMDTNKSVTAHFLANCYTLTLSHSGQGSDPVASPNSSGSCPAGQYVVGTTINLSGAVPASGWEISGWSGTNNNSSTASSNTVSMPASNHTASVNYSEITYDLTMAVDPTGGGSTNPSVGAHSYAEGSEVDITATANPGYVFDYWEGDVADPDSVSTTVTMDADQEVTAHFLANCYTLTLSHTGQGSDLNASPSSSGGCPASQYVVGTNINLSGAVPDSGWEISGWSGTINNASTASSNTVSMPASNHTASVIYTEIPTTCYALTLGHTGLGSTPTASPTNSTGCSLGEYLAGESINLSGALADNDWLIDSWYGTDDDTSTESTNTVIMPGIPHSAGVNYVPEITCYALTLSHTGQGTDPEASPAYSPGCSAGEYVSGASINLSGAVPESGWKISGWTGTDNNVSAASTNVVTMPASAHTASVNYTEITYNLTLAVEPLGTGTTNPSAGVHSFAVGTVVTVTVTPVAGYSFDYWSGACSGSGTCQVIMNADQTVTAHFEEITYNLTMVVDPPGGGSTQPAAGVHTYPEGTVVDVGAAAAAGYTFDHWSGACSGDTTCQVVMNANQTVTASFEELSLTCYTLTVSHSGQGSDPLASPASSIGCPAGEYLAGESINLSGAVPTSGWGISGWTGTDNDNSTASSNSLTMPARDHVVQVIYEVYTYIPLVFMDNTSK